MTFDLRNQNRLNGKWCDSLSNGAYAIHNPADMREMLYCYPLSDARDALPAIESAARTQPHWRKVSVAEKSGIMRRAVRLIEENRDQIARVITEVNGKLYSESLAEIDSTVVELEYQVGEGERQFGHANQLHRSGAWGFTRKEPLGVVAVIVPWNFPFNVPFRKLVPALMAGNTAILKPASQTAAVGELVVHILTEAGLPTDVLQFITGSGNELSDALVASNAIRAVTFTGSTSVGRAIAQKTAPQFVRTQLEMGGKNPAVVLADSDLEWVAERVVESAYSCAGQWCTATSRLIVEQCIHDELVEKILRKVSQLKLGSGMDRAATMGPVCGCQQLSSILQHIDTAREQGGAVLFGGTRNTDGNLQFGCFVRPTIFLLQDNHSELSKEEVLGPVLAIETARDFEHAVEIANKVRYGRSFSIFTNDLDRALDFAARTEVGMMHVNMHSAHRELEFSFGGATESGFGSPEACSAGIQFFQEEKTVYLQRKPLAVG